MASDVDSTSLAENTVDQLPDVPGAE